MQAPEPKVNHKLPTSHKLITWPDDLRDFYTREAELNLAPVNSEIVRALRLAKDLRSREREKAAG
jgi:hypothetical protein